MYFSETGTKTGTGLFFLPSKPLFAPFAPWLRPSRSRTGKDIPARIRPAPACVLPLIMIYFCIDPLQHRCAPPGLNSVLMLLGIFFVPLRRSICPCERVSSGRYPRPALPWKAAPAAVPLFCSIKRKQPAKIWRAVFMPVSVPVCCSDRYTPGKDLCPRHSIQESRNQYIRP